MSMTTTTGCWLNWVSGNDPRRPDLTRIPLTRDPDYLGCVP